MPSATANPLEEAIARGCVECIRILVASSPFYDLNGIVGVEGLLPVHVAAREGHLQVLRYLQSINVNLGALDAKGSNGIHYAANAGQPRAVRWLLRHGVAAVVNRSNESPASVASQLHHMEIISLLAKYSKKAESSSSANTSNTAPPPLPPPNNGQTHRHHNHQVDSGNSSLSSSAQQPPTSLTLTAGSCHCSSTESSSSSSTASSTPSEDASSSSPSTILSAQSSVYTVRSVNSFFLHPPNKSRSGNANSFYLHQPRSAGTIIHEESDSDQRDPTTSSNTDSNGIKLKSSLKPSRSSDTTSTSSFVLHSPHSSSSSTSSTTLVDDLPLSPRETVVKFEIPASSSDDFSPPSSTTTTTCTNGHISAPFHLHENEPPLSIQYSLDYSIETTMAPVNNQFVISSPVVVKSELKAGGGAPPPPPPPPPPPEFADSKSVIKGGAPPPPPPPPPPPALTPGGEGLLKTTPKGSSETPEAPPNPADVYNLRNIVKEKVTKSKSSPPPLPRSPSSSAPPPPPPPKLPDLTAENEYEDIDEVQSRRAADSDAAERGRKQEPEYVTSKEAIAALQGVLSRGLTNKKPAPGSRQVSFIPPSFQAPPEDDQLIKPSEYLKSIKSSKGSNSNSGSSSVACPSSPAPPMSDHHAQLERSISNMSSGSSSTESDGGRDHRENVPPPPNPPSALKLATLGGGPGGTGMIRAEELMKVNLRKAPTTRTASAPILGRVISNDSNCESPPASPVTKAPAPPPPGTTSNKPAGLQTKAAVIAELEQSSHCGSVREWKEELRRRQMEEQNQAVKELAQIYTPTNFVSEVPNTDNSGAEIPAWKRQMLAKKAAEKARREAEEQLKQDAEARRMASIPPWRRQLLQRRESDGKCVQ